MDTKEPDHSQRRFEDGAFLFLVLLISIAFAWLIWPFFGAILWGLIAGILFKPPYEVLVGRLGGHRNLAAALTLLLILLLIVAPAILLGVALVQEAAALYVQLQTGKLDLAGLFVQVRGTLPPWADQMLRSSGLTDLDTAREMLGASVTSVLQSIAARALLFGQGALELLAALGVMLYLTFFLLRDGREIGRKVRAAIPLRPELRDDLIRHFVVVVRATIKGTFVVAIVQGLVGGLIFWMLGIEAPLLWGLLMALFSLFPAVGTGIVWVPVAIYLLATGSVTEGVILTLCGFFVIGLIDNLL
ncbi:MAG TPA: AI-2E family transporter, partial [Novosphingobium sp.]|nr:AI-2E family transporter [Novosphingobium sp.]